MQNRTRNLIIAAAIALPAVGLVGHRASARPASTTAAPTPTTCGPRPTTGTPTRARRPSPVPGEGWRLGSSGHGTRDRHGHELLVRPAPVQRRQSGYVDQQLHRQHDVAERASTTASSSPSSRPTSPRHVATVNVPIALNMLNTNPGNATRGQPPDDQHRRGERSSSTARNRTPGRSSSASSVSGSLTLGAANTIATGNFEIN